MGPLCSLCLSVVLSCLFLAALWSPAGKRADLLALLYVMFCMYCYFPVWCPGSVVVFDCSGLDSKV